MSSKLVGLPGLRAPVPARIDLPYLPEQINAVVTVIVLKNNQVEVLGAVAEESIGEAILKGGLERLHQWHAQQRAAKAAQASGTIVGPDGLPIMGGQA